MPKIQDPTTDTGATRGDYIMIYDASAPRTITLGNLLKTVNWLTDASRCLYCGNTGSTTNVRGGVECAGCGHPK